MKPLHPLSAFLMILLFGPCGACGDSSAKPPASPSPRGRFNPPEPEMPARIVPDDDAADSPSLADHENLVDSSTGIQILSMQVVANMEGTEPDPTAPFCRGKKAAFASFEVHNSTDDKRQLIVVFTKPDGGRGGRVPLTIPASSKKWRTTGRSHYLRQAGVWTVTAFDTNKAQLGSRTFRVDEC